MTTRRASAAGLDVRQVQSNDLDMLGPFAARAFVDAFRNQVPEGDLVRYAAQAFSQSRLQDEFAADGSTFLLAERHGRPAGYARLLETAPPGVEAVVTAVRIVRLYVEYSSIGSGVGSLLMQACIDRASTAGARLIWLRVWEHNARAIEFYERWGFRRTATVDFDIGTTIVTDVIMERDLPKPALIDSTLAAAEDL